MTKVDFMFTIGFQGISAIVDKHAKKQFAKFDALQLAEKGLFKPAFCAALFDNDTVKQEEIISIYNKMSGEVISKVETMKRMLGVFEVPVQITKVTGI